MSSGVSFAGSKAAVEIPAGIGSDGREGCDGVGRNIMGGEGVGRPVVGEGTGRTVGEGTVLTGEASFGAVGVGRTRGGAEGFCPGVGEGVERGMEGGDLDSGREDGPGRAWAKP